MRLCYYCQIAKDLRYSSDAYSQGGAPAGVHGGPKSLFHVAHWAQCSHHYQGSTLKSKNTTLNVYNNSIDTSATPKVKVATCQRCPRALSNISMRVPGSTLRHLSTCNAPQRPSASVKFSHTPSSQSVASHSRPHSLFGKVSWRFGTASVRKRLCGSRLTETHHRVSHFSGGAVCDPQGHNIVAKPSVGLHVCWGTPRYCDVC